LSSLRRLELFALSNDLTRFGGDVIPFSNRILKGSFPNIKSTNQAVNRIGGANLVDGVSLTEPLMVFL
jgi:hypothetical protein